MILTRSIIAVRICYIAVGMWFNATAKRPLIESFNFVAGFVVHPVLMGIKKCYAELSD